MNCRPLVTAVVLILSSFLYGQTSQTCLWSTKSDPAALIESCSKALESAGLSAAARAKLLDARGHAYLDKRDYGKALADFNEAIRLSPTYADVFDHRGMVFADTSAAETQQDFPRAIQDFNEALRLKPDDIEALLHRGMAYNNDAFFSTPTGNARDVEAGLAQADFKTALQLLNDRLARDPKNAGLLKHRAWAYHAMDDETNALRDLEAAWKLDPADPQTAMLLGDVHEAQGQVVEAIESYTNAIQLHPDDPEGYKARGELLSLAQQAELAVKDFSEALRLRPDYAEALANRGNAYSQLEKDEQAIEDYTAALRLQPHAAETYYDRGVSYGHILQYDKAIVDYDKAISLNGNSPLFYNARANAYRNLGQYKRSIPDYDKALSLKPDFDAVLYNRGRAYAMAGMEEQALADLDEYAKRVPDDMDTYEDRGLARFYAGKFPSAALDLGKVVQQNPKNLYDWFFLYLAQSRAGQDGMPALHTAAGNGDTRKWPSTVLAYLLGQIDQGALLEAAKNDDPKVQSGHFCEAYFYLGEAALLKGDAKAAQRWFSEAEKTGVATYWEYRAAESELERLGSKTQ